MVIYVVKMQHFKDMPYKPIILENIPILPLAFLTFAKTKVVAPPFVPREQNMFSQNVLKNEYENQHKTIKPPPLILDMEINEIFLLWF